MATIGMYNEEGVNVDLYIPRKCHASNTLIPSFDFGSVQISIADIDANGTIVAGQTKTFCIAGFIRSQGASDHAINHLCIEHGIIRGKTGRQTKASKKKQAVARKRFAGKPQAKITKKGGKPQGKRPEGKRGPRPEGARGPRPEGARGPRPEGARGPRPEGARGPRPEGKRAPRPAKQE